MFDQSSRSSDISVRYLVLLMCITVSTFAVSRPLLNHEADLKYEFAAQQIYPIRYDQIEGLEPPVTSMAEALSYSFLMHGQARWHQLQRLMSLLPGDKALRWAQQDPLLMATQEPKHASP